jgi:hypothetical protein
MLFTNEGRIYFSWYFLTSFYYDCYRIILIAYKILITAIAIFLFQFPNKLKLAVCSRVLTISDLPENILIQCAFSFILRCIH